ncbi:ATP-binding cassette domain-containing protein [Streptosporangium vulgare]|uniref:ATP-binding cassette domain-containing protein n=1 Tax=Streptosporangium vulgare TaxID=46190 RepID=UPI0031E171F8
MIYQHPLASFDPRYTARQLLEEPLRAEGVPGAGRARRVAELLGHVGLDEGVLGRRARELSGGQRQRLAIARALAPRPDVIICDEPVSALDAVIQAQVLDVLADVQERLGVAYVFISHDLGVIRRISHEVVVMKDGKAVESGDIRKVFEAPEHQYTKTLLTRFPDFTGPARPTHKQFLNRAEPALPHICFLPNVVVVARQWRRSFLFWSKDEGNDGSSAVSAETHMSLRAAARLPGDR